MRVTRTFFHRHVDDTLNVDNNSYHGLYIHPTGEITGDLGRLGMGQLGIPQALPLGQQQQQQQI